MERTAIGMEAETVRPARRPTYTETAPNKIPKSEPNTIARRLNSRTLSSESTYGRNSPGGAVELQGFVATLCLPCHIAERRCEHTPDRAQQSGQVSITRAYRQGAIGWAGLCFGQEPGRRIKRGERSWRRHGAPAASDLCQVTLTTPSAGSIDRRRRFGIALDTRHYLQTRRKAGAGSGPGRGAACNSENARRLA